MGCTLQDHRELIMSNRVLKKVLQELIPADPQPVSTGQIDALRKNLNVIPPSGETFESANVLILEYTDDTPARAAQVAAAITQSYLEVYQEITKAKTDYSYSFYLEQTQKLNKEMLDKENNLREFETRQALVLIEILDIEPGKAKQETGPNSLLSQFLRHYHELQTELAGLRLSIKYLERDVHKKGVPVVPPEMELPASTISRLKDKVSQLQLQLNPQFKEKFDLLKQPEQEADLVGGSLNKELKRSEKAQKINAQSIAASIQQIEKNIQYLKGQIQSTVRDKTTYEKLKQEYTIAKESYTRVRVQLEQARMAHSFNPGKQLLTLIDKPEVPSAPFKPNRLLLVIGGLVLGIFSGIAIALTGALFDHRLKTVWDIETHLKVPVLGSIQNV
jgi:uncharacterized protein involved in exopolysaccharide biosynthesis